MLYSEGGGAIIGPSNNPVRRESGGRQTSLTGIGTVESFLHDIVPILIPQHIQENAVQKKMFTTVIIRVKLCSQEAIFICCQYYYTCLVNLNVAIYYCAWGEGKGVRLHALTCCIMVIYYRVCILLLLYMQSIYGLSIYTFKMCSQEAIFICCQYYYTCLVNLNVAKLLCMG